jgi:3-dehydroquinate synthase
MIELIKKETSPLILIDKNLKKKILSSLDFEDLPIYEIEALEKNKNIENVLKICEFLTAHNANRGSMLFVIGGGIIQDLGAFSAAMYKRGIPWKLIPTTLLCQTDSCLGGKTAVNFKDNKNVLGLFSAPREVIINEEFLLSLNNEDIYSGAGEILRLMITGGVETFNILEKNIDQLAAGNLETIKELMKHSLNVKKVVVEHDEFELDIRRSMNYGHSIGHALEAASSYAIPHGQGVTVGILIENKMSLDRGLLSYEDYTRIKAVGEKLLSNRTKTFLSMYNTNSILDYLKSDKKAVGNILKLSIIEKIGDMKFIDFPLDATGQEEISKAFNDVFKK